MDHFDRILDNNRRWAAEMVAADAEFFARRAGRQAPHFLFIGCSDSRVPAEMLTGAAPGEMFIHRNIANQVHPSDLNVLSVLQYAVEVLDVEHVVVCGHYGCGGVAAATDDGDHGLVDHWLGNIRGVARRHAAELEALGDAEARGRRLVELNAVEQVVQLARTPIVRGRRAGGRRPALHALVYDLRDGRLRTLVHGVDGVEAAGRLGRADAPEPVPAGAA